MDFLHEPAPPAMAEKRIIFTFDKHSLANLQALKGSTRMDTLGQTIGVLIQVATALSEQKQQGYTEVIVRNPRTEKERVLTMPDL